MTASVTPDVLVVGGGPAGLTAAAELARRHLDVLVLEREDDAGGIPRHSDHLGYGVRDLHRMLTGPAYARRLAAAAVEVGADVRTQAMVTSWATDGSALATTPQGRLSVDARAVVLATGARERPRSARLVPGRRVAGVYTTGQLQNTVHLFHRPPGRRAVVVGTELVSWSAVLTLREAGCRTVLMTTALPRPESFPALARGAALAARTRIATSARIVDVHGHGRVEAVEIEDARTGGRRVVECDTVVFTGDWVPDHELARRLGLTMDAGTRGPQVDAGLRTSRPGVFAAGNLVHPVDTADVAALGGRHAARQVVRWLAASRPPGDGVALVAQPPLRWISPNLLRPDDPAPARRRLLAWTAEPVARPTVVVRQAGREIARRRVPWPASPGRAFRIPRDVLDAVDHLGGPVTVHLVASWHHR